MKIKVILICLLFLAASKVLNAQNYKMGIGGRFGFYNGITFKGFISKNGALEGFLTTRWGGAIITGMYEYQMAIPEVKGLDWFAGGGVHFGYLGGEHYDWGAYNHSGYSVMGADVVLGAEYTLKDYPFSASLDWKPAFNFINDDHFWFDGFALSLRYTFKK